MKTTTIEYHFINQMKKNDSINQDILKILYDISIAAKLIRQQVIRGGLTTPDLRGSSGTTNESGEDVQALDIYSNNIMKDILLSHQRFSYLGSEEEPDVVTSDTYQSSEYVILFDPLDGSSNIDVNVSVGTIFSIFRKNKHAKQPLDHCCQKGSEQIASGYIIYGSSVLMVYTAGNGVHGFTYDPMIGEFLLSHENIKIPETPNYYSVNEALYNQCDTANQQFIDQLKSLLSLRYVGSLVADFHRNLLKGGIYIYPSTNTSPNGKLRLLYEANPLAFICEQAGGAATNGRQQIMDIQPTELHQRVPLYIGSKNLVQQFNTASNSSYKELNAV